MEQSIADICDEPMGAKEELVAAWMEALEDCGMTLYREPKVVSRRRLNLVSMNTVEDWE